METLKKLDTTLESVFVTKAPALPDDIQDVIVRYGPYLVIIGVLLGAASIVSMTGLRSLSMQYVGSHEYMRMYEQISPLFTLSYALALVFQGLAIPGLLKKTKQGWTYLWYGTLVSIVSNLIQVNVAGLVIGALLGLYVLYQVKKHYS